MKHYLIKHMQSGYLLTSSDKIVEGDTIYWNKGICRAINTSYVYPTQKIVASDFMTALPAINFSLISEEVLNKKGLFNYQALQEKYLMKTAGSLNYAMRESFVDGIKHAEQILFSYDDLFKAFQFFAFASISQQPYNIEELNQKFNDFISSLNKKWEVLIKKEEDVYYITEIL